MAITIEEYVSKVVSEAPPLTAEQADRIAVLLRPAGAPYTPPPETIRQQAIREAQYELDKIQKKYREALDSCGICGLSPLVHKMQGRNVMDYHELIPLAVDQIIQISETFKPKIEDAETQLKEAKKPSTAPTKETVWKSS